MNYKSSHSSSPAKPGKFHFLTGKKLTTALCISAFIAFLQILLYVKLAAAGLFQIRILLMICLFYCLVPVVAIVKTLRDDRLASRVYYLRRQKEASEKRAQALALTKKEAEEQTGKTLEQMKQLYHLLSNRKLEEAEVCTRSLQHSLEQGRFYHYCTNETVNTILYSKKLVAEKNSIRISYQITFPSQISITTAELISLFFNLLDNGFDACITSGEKSPYLNLNVDYKGDFLILVMVNSKNKAVRFDHETTKSDSYLHGFGLSIIEDLAQKRDGLCQWSDHDNYFESRIMLRY
ncbi:MAG: GHKL domain-containing protein [Lachnospiraceae bacterium]|nr:GHKL domain-containing protein [Lachnospiraceae bacterium]